VGYQNVLLNQQSHLLQNLAAVSVAGSKRHHAWRYPSGAIAERVTRHVTTHLRRSNQTLIFSEDEYAAGANYDLRLRLTFCRVKFVYGYKIIASSHQTFDGRTLVFYGGFLRG